MKKVLVIIATLLLITSISFVSVSAEEVDTPTEEVNDNSLEETFEYYIRLVCSYAVSIGGTLSGLLLIFSRIKKVLGEVKEGTKSIEEAKIELELQKKELLKQQEEFVKYTDAFKEAILDEEQLQVVKTHIERISKAFEEMVVNDSKLVGSGAAKKIQLILEGSEEDVKSQ